MEKGKYADLVAYFEQLARSHKDIAHTDSDKHFFRFELEEMLTGMRSKINYPALVLEGYDFEFTDEKSDNVHKRLNCAFMILGKVNDKGEFDLIHNLWDRLEEIGNEIMNVDGIESLKDYRDLLVKFYPESERDIDEVLKVIVQVMKNMDVLYGIENPNFKDLKNDRTFLLKTLLPWLPRFIFTIGKINQMNMPVEARERFVLDQNDTQYHYDHLIWAADLKTLYRITDTQGFSQKIRSRFAVQKEVFETRRGGDSVYTLYLEVNEPSSSFQQIANGHFFYTPSKQGLGETHRQELNNILDNWEKTSKEELLIWFDKLLSLNTFEISIPGLKDHDLTPVGQTGLIISILTDYELFSQLKNAGWYEEFVSIMEDSIIRILSESVYPMLEGKILSKFSFTPLSIARRVGSSEGAITGWSFEESVPVINKIQQSGRSVITPIPNIFQAGQWTYSPAGVPMSILTGKLAANKVLKARG